MAVTAKALREKQEAIEITMRQHRDKITADDYKFDNADEAAWTRMNGEYDSLASQIRQIEAADDILKNRDKSKEEAAKLRTETTDKRSHKTNPDAPLSAEERATAVTGYLLRFLVGTALALAPETRQAMKKAQRQGVVGVKGRELAIKLNTRQEFVKQQRALAFGAGAGNAGPLGPDGFVNSLELNMLAFGSVQQVCTILRTDNGRPMNAPYADDTANEGVIVGEAALVATLVDPTIGEQIWGAYKINSKRTVYSSEAGEDSMFDLPSLLGAMCGERIGRGENRYCTTGTGTAQHQGIVVGAALGVTAALTTAFTTDELVNLEHSVDVAYRTNAAYMMHDTILAFVRKLKYAGSGEYVYNFDKGSNGTINGRQVQVNNHMASALTTAQKLVVFGDFKKYVLRQVNTLRLRRNVELHADNDQESVQAFLRSDGKIQSAGTAPMTYLRLA